MAYWTGTMQGTLAEKATVEAKLKKAAAHTASPLDGDPFGSTNSPTPDLAKDPAAGLEKLTELPGGSEKAAAYETAFLNWAKNPENAPAAAAAAMALPPGLEQKAAISGLTESWATSDPKACLDWETSQPILDTERLKLTLLGVAGQHGEDSQPAIAAQYVDKLQDASARNEVIGQIGRAWGTGGDGWQIYAHHDNADPAAALEWLDKVATGTTYDSTVSTIFQGVSAQDPAQAATLLDKVTDANVREGVINDLARIWSIKSPQDALTWVQSLPDSESVRNNALATIIGGMATDNPAAAVALIQNAAVPLDAATTKALMDEWTNYDPPAALAWANSLPDGPAKNAAMDKGLVTLSETDFDSAWNYATNLTANNPNSPLLGDIMDRLTLHNAAKASTLLSQLPTEAAQLEEYGQVGAKWATQNPAAFAQWVNTLPPGPLHDKAVSSAMDQFAGSRLNPVDTALLHILTQSLQNKPAP
jgi:hypothetical protein